MSDLIRRDELLKKECCGRISGDDVRNAPAVDAVEVDTVAEMLYRGIGDRCACNVNDNDEWLSEVCELQEQCPHPKDILGCWKQFVKHYRSEKMEHLEGE